MNIEKNLSIVKRYAKSLIDLANEDNISSDVIKNDLENIKIILKNSQDLYSVLINPVISAQDKENIIDEVFKQDTNQTSRNFLKLLIEKNRFNCIFSIIEVFNKFLDEINNIVKVDVTCAIELNNDNKEKIQAKLKTKLNKKIEVNYSIDDKILAGLIFKIEDDVLDSSLKKKLEEFKKELIK